MDYCPPRTLPYRSQYRPRLRPEKGIRRQALGRSRGGLTTKLHLRCNAFGFPVNWIGAACDGGSRSTTGGCRSNLSAKRDPKTRERGHDPIPRKKSLLWVRPPLKADNMPTTLFPMSIALHIAGLPSQSQQGMGARLVRRLGGAVRSVIGSGISFAGTLRRPAVPQTSRSHAAAQDPEAPSAPSRVPVRQRPRTALPVPLSVPPLLARLLARRHCRPAPISRPAFLNQGDMPFTPEAFPQLSPSLCRSQHPPQGLRSQDPGAAGVRARPAHQSGHVARIGHHGSRGSVSQPVAPHQHRPRRHQGRNVTAPNARGSASHSCGCSAGCVGRIAASAGTADQAVDKQRAAHLAATAVRPARLRPAGRRHDDRRRTGEPARHRCPVQTCRAPKRIVPIQYTIFHALAPMWLTTEPTEPHPCVSVCICGSILLLPLCRLHRPALSDRRRPIRHMSARNERGHRTAVPPTRFVPGEPRRTLPPAGIAACRVSTAAAVTFYSPRRRTRPEGLSPRTRARTTRHSCR